MTYLINVGVRHLCEFRQGALPYTLNLSSAAANLDNDHSLPNLTNGYNGISSTHHQFCQFYREDH